MAVATKEVVGRRTIKNETLDDLLQDAEQVVDKGCDTVGNWTVGQIMRHLATSMDGSMDGYSFSLPAPVRLIMRLTMKKKFLTQTMPAGYKIPAKAASFVPIETSPEEGLSLLRTAIGRLKQETKRALNPALGRLTVEEWNQFHLRHAALHMSFAVLRG